MKELPKKGRNTINVLKMTHKTEDEIDYENDIYCAWYTISNHQLTISRKDCKPVESWYDIWNIKNQILGDSATMVEIYPSKSDLIDGQNQRHLFILDTEEKVSFENAYEIINMNCKTKNVFNTDNT